MRNTDKNSPKTPGGISKSLLTPCRRVGLSRNWNKNGPSPFKSPLSSTDVFTPVRNETKKRKQPSDEVDNDEEPLVSFDVADVNNELICKREGNCNEIVSTPGRKLKVPIKKSRLRVPINNINKYESISIPSSPSVTCKEVEVLMLKDLNESNPASEGVQSNKRKKSPMKPKENVVNMECDRLRDIEKKEAKNENDHQKEKSPKDLTKECIVVIQKKIFKVKSNEVEAIEALEGKNSKLIDTNNSQVLYDSDSDDAPLSTLNNRHVQLNEDIENTARIEDDDDDFIDTSNRKNIDKYKENKLEKLSIQKIRNKVIKNEKIKKKTIDKTINERDSSQGSSPFDDDDDFDNKRTILIRKTYDKVTKPSKAKSTGSITQKDIDDLRERIETKKKLLLAKAMTRDTKELRELIKKWQKGCQDALMELMDLMKKKFPDKQYMEYAEILKMLNIPRELVGYDSENDCFNTPEDASIVLSKFHNL